MTLTSNGLKGQSAKNIFKTFKSDKVKNANIIIELFKELQSDDAKDVRKSLIVIHRIFSQLIVDGDIKIVSSKIPSNVKTATHIYDEWLFERYTEVHSLLLNLLDHSIPQVQKLSLCMIVKLVQKEAGHPFSKEKIYNLKFPYEKLKQLVAKLLSNSTDYCGLIKHLRECLEFPDFLFALLSVFSPLVASFKPTNANEIYINNLFSFLENITLPEDGKKTLLPPKLFSDAEKDPDQSFGRFFEFPYKEAKQYFNNIWEAVFNYNFSSAMYKRCLILLPEKVMMHLEMPVRLTDFFMNAYNLGGAVSLMALQGIFILVTQHNIEYPDFYSKVYALLEPNIFHAKYKPRFFMLCNKFLSSPLLPEYVVAAFAKRLSRLMLVAPSSSLNLLIKFVVNLLLRYPSLHRIVQNPNVTNLENDPYVEDEPNLLLCRAGESSLWEVAALRDHPLGRISKASNFIIRNLPDVEHDVSKFVENTYKEVFEMASKIREQRISATFYKPESIFKYSDHEMMLSTWSGL